MPISRIIAQVIVADRFRCRGYSIKESDSVVGRYRRTGMDTGSDYRYTCRTGIAIA